MAKAKAAAMEIEKRTRLQAAANQAMASGGAATAAQMNPVIGSKYPNLQKPVPAQKPMSDAMQVLTFLYLFVAPLQFSGSHGGDNCCPSFGNQQGHFG